MNTDSTLVMSSFDRSIGRFEWLLIAVAAVFLAYNTFTTAIIDNDRSRLATVDSLVERGTWVIDKSRFHQEPGSDYQIIDKVKVGDHFYSSKPPVLPFLMAGEYWVFHHLFGLDFHHEKPRKFLIWVLTFTFTGIPFLWIAVLFRYASRWFIEDPVVRLTGLFMILFCNEVWGFAQTVNNHVPGASLLFSAMVWGIGLVRSKLPPTSWHFIIAGLFAGMLPVVELPGALFCIALWLYLLRAFPRQTLVWFTIGAAPPLLLHFGLTYFISGSLIPFYMRKELYDFEGGYFGNAGLQRAMDAAGEYESKSTYLFHLSVGRKGLFSLYPVLLLSLAHIFRSVSFKPWNPSRIVGLLALVMLPVLGCFAWAENLDSTVGYLSSLFFFLLFALVPTILVWLMARPTGSLKDHQEPPLCLESIGLGALVIAWMMVFTFTEDNYGGSATGFRWFMFFTPALQFFGLFSLDRMKEGWRWGLVCILVGISFYSGWQATVQPWSMNFDWPVTFLGKWITR